jgi:hypothetical protein
MDLIKIYAREFLYYCANYHFLLMNKEDRAAVCERLKISDDKLYELVEYCLSQNYVTVFDGNFPYYLNPTYSGFAAVGLDRDGGRLDYGHS